MKFLKLTTIFYLTVMIPTSYAVTIVNNSDGSGYAYGLLKSNTDSSSITCARAEGIAHDSHSAYTSTWCSANDGAGNTAYCYTSDPDFAKAIQGLSDYGRLWFRWSTSGGCGAMQIVNSTNYLPAE